MAAIKVKAKPEAFMDLRIFRAKTGKWEQGPRVGLSSKFARFLQRLKGR